MTLHRRVLGTYMVFQSLCLNAFFPLQTVAWGPAEAIAQQELLLPAVTTAYARRHTHTEAHSEHRARGNNSCDLRNTCLLPGEGDK